jgi:Tfp pilus assembly protein PilO
MMDKIKSFPFMLIFICYAFYMGYSVFEFHEMEDGASAQHQAQMNSLNVEIDGLNKRLEEGKKFLKTLELKKADLQAQAKRLADFQVTLSDAPDVPALIKTLIGEAKQIDLKVSRIDPGKKTPREFYMEQEFSVEVRGTFQQIALFAMRVSKLQRILRIEAYNLRPDTSPTSKKSSVVAALSVRAYQYTLSNADNIAKATESIKTGVTR